MNKMCSVSLAKDVIKYDYCAKESILNMLEFSDYVIICYVESSDNTLELLKSIKSEKLEIIELTIDDWNFYNDKNRLSYITNIGIQKADKLGFQYVFSLQMDEIVHESSYESIRKAVESNEEAFFVNRINLWKTPEFQLNVPQERKPCSTEIIRLAKAKYRAYDDAESIAAPAQHIIEDAHIFHYGFVRKKEIMKDKIINMQCGVFSMINYDSKLDLCDVFNPDLWFNPEKDLIPIKISTPKLMEEWVKTRP